MAILRHLITEVIRPVGYSTMYSLEHTLSRQDWTKQCFSSPPTQYRLYGRRFLQVKRPNQQYQSTEGKSTKENNPENKENTKYTYAYTHKIVDKYSIQE